MVVSQFFLEQHKVFLKTRITAYLLLKTLQRYQARRRK